MTRKEQLVAKLKEMGLWDSSYRFASTLTLQSIIHKAQIANSKRRNR